MTEYNCDDCDCKIESKNMCIDEDGAFLCDMCYEKRLQKIENGE